MQEIAWNLYQYLIAIYNFSFQKSFLIMLSLFLSYFFLLCLQHKKISVRNLCYGILFSFYVSQVIGITLLNRTTEEVARFDLNLFEVYRIALQGNDVFMIQLIANIVMFLPFGFFLPLCFRKLAHFLDVLVCSFAFSLGIETMQLFTHTGVFEIPDLINNTLGGLIGFFCYAIFRVLVKIRKNILNFY